MYALVTVAFFVGFAVSGCFGALLMLNATTVMHEIAALVLFLISALFFVGAGVLAVIRSYFWRVNECLEAIYKVQAQAVKRQE